MSRGLGGCWGGESEVLGGFWEGRGGDEGDMGFWGLLGREVRFGVVEGCEGRELGVLRKA